jgi:hypothetical protein
MEILYPEGEKSLCWREASVRQVSLLFMPVWYGQQGVEKDPRMIFSGIIQYNSEYINFIKFQYNTILVESD